MIERKPMLGINISEAKSRPNITEIPHFSQIDISVLEALPDDIKQEIIQEYQLPPSRQIEAPPPRKKSTFIIRRGRPKKKSPHNVTIHTMINKINVMNDQHRKEMDNIRDGVYSISYDVIKELPKSIQIEILNNKISKNKRRVKGMFKDVESAKIKAEKEDQSMVFCPVRKNIQEMRIMLERWMDKEEEETAKEVYMELLLQCINQLMCYEKDFESAVKVLRMVRRLALKHKANLWHNMFNNLLQHVNEEILPKSGLCDTEHLAELCID